MCAHARELMCVCECVCLYMQACWSRRGQTGEPGEVAMNWLTQSQTLGIIQIAVGVHWKDFKQVRDMVRNVF